MYEKTNIGWLVYRKISTGQRTLRSHKYTSTGEFESQKPRESEIALVYRAGDYYKIKSHSIEGISTTLPTIGTD